MSSPIIWGGPGALNLTSSLEQGSVTGSSLITGTVDPTSVATAGFPGSIYQNASTAKTYVKQDSGTTTNWLQLLAGPASTTNANVSVYYPLSNTNYWDCTTTSGGYIDYAVVGTIPTPTVLNNNGFTAPAVASGSKAGLSFTAPSTGTLYIQFNAATYSNSNSFQTYYRLQETTGSTIFAYSGLQENNAMMAWVSTSGYLNVTQGQSYNVIIQANGNGGDTYVSFNTPVSGIQAGLVINLNYVGLTQLLPALVGGTNTTITTTAGVTTIGPTDQINLATARGFALP
jgi:hypothetical protein